MKGAHHDPVDHSRTTQPHAGESFIDTLWLPGLWLIGLGALTIAGMLAAMAYQHDEWLLPLCLVSGALVTCWRTAEMDIAVDPLEGTTLTSKGGPGAIATIALAEQGNFLHAPDIYMDKIAVGGGLPDGLVDLDAPVGKNLQRLARAKRCEVSDLVACILDRDRHKELIAKTREAGARIMLISDGDVAGVIATTMPNSEIDIYLGSGGAPEGVLAAAALRCVGGQMQGRLMFEDDAQRDRVRAMGHADPNGSSPARRWRRATSCSPAPASRPARCCVG